MRLPSIRSCSPASGRCGFVEEKIDFYEGRQDDFRREIVNDIGTFPARRQGGSGSPVGACLSAACTCRASPGAATRTPSATRHTQTGLASHFSRKIPFQNMLRRTSLSWSARNAHVLPHS